MAANKIILNNEVLIDLTTDTAVEASVESGKTFHKADGTVGTGSLVLPSGTIEIVAIGTHNVKDYENAEVNLPVYGGEIEDVVNLIAFTIDGTEHQAEEGMTWDEWCKSNYNTIGCRVLSNGNIGLGNANKCIVDEVQVYVHSDNAIIDGAKYTGQSVSND